MINRIHSQTSRLDSKDALLDKIESGKAWSCPVCHIFFSLAGSKNHLRRSHGWEYNPGSPNDPVPPSDLLREGE